jgi:tetratricopeptide (TPR) repeat protein
LSVYSIALSPTDLTVTQTGRNQPCPCGSGKKYKRCCLALHEAAAHEQARLRREAADSYEQVLDEMNALDALSNQTNDAIKAGRFDEAERMCDELQRLHPDQIDALDRRALLAEARGDLDAALAWRRKCLAFAQTKDGFEDASLDWMREQIAALEAKAAKGK